MPILTCTGQYRASVHADTMDGAKKSVSGGGSCAGLYWQRVGVGQGYEECLLAKLNCTGLR